jgi:hypothetical protein
MREARVQALSLKIEKMIYNPRWLCKMIGQASRRRAAIDWPPAEWSRWNVSLSRDPPPASGHRHARCGPRPSPTPANLAECGEASLCGSVVRTCTHEHPDAPHALTLLHPRRKRPRCHAAEQRNELAAYHSITSSARAKSPPSAQFVSKKLQRDSHAPITAQGCADYARSPDCWSHVAMPVLGELHHRYFRA